MVDMHEHGWLVCSPGDLNDNQIATGYLIGGKDHVCFTRWNADTGDVIAEITRKIGDGAYHEIKYLIQPNGDADLITESEEIS